jgi:hypothetical protein
MTRYVTLTLVTAAILLSPAAFAEGTQIQGTRTQATQTQATQTKNAGGKAVPGSHAKQRPESARQSFGALPSSGATNSGDGFAIARPPAQPAQ